MMGLIDLAILGIILFLSIPVFVLFFECLLAVLPSFEQKSESENLQPFITILIPAHNEAPGISATIQPLLSQLKAADQLIVIADNCTDETAEISRALGATVLERNNLKERGKGYALDYGLKKIENNPPDVIIMVDADCRVEAGAIQKIAQKAMETARPVQALYLMETPPNPTPKNSVSALAFLVKNLVRPQGLAQVGMPCPLTGTGMAFPWSVIRQISVASGNIVEDMQLGVDLAIAGTPPLFCQEALVTGILPQQQQAATQQRTRWEHGHLQTIRTQVPRLLEASLRQKRLDLLVMALDLCVPPLSLLVMLWFTVLIIGAIAAISGLSWQPAILAALDGVLQITTIITAWAKFGRDTISLATLLSVPAYILWKIPLYFTFIFKPQKEWVRTERDSIKTPEA